MRTGLRLTLGVAVLALAGGSGTAGLPAHPAPSGPAAASVDTVYVDANDRLVFQPDSVVIHVGDVVQWRNAGLVQHSVTADPSLATLPGSARLPEGARTFNSGLLAEGETYSHTFRVPGRYDYFCMPHEGAGMNGTVVVLE